MLPHALACEQVHCSKLVWHSWLQAAGEATAGTAACILPARQQLRRRHLHQVHADLTCNYICHSNFRFVELGKRDAVDGANLAQKALMNNVSFVSAHIDMLARARPAAFCKVGTGQPWLCATTTISQLVFAVPDLVF
jgi:hypothetical protein